MLASISGTLREVSEDRVYLESGALVYELLVPAANIESLQSSLAEQLTFHTLFYIEGDASGGNLAPRLIGFLDRQDKSFFEKFITVKGIGPKKALKALVRPIGEIAQAIESRDARFLSQLPQIGKRTAEQIIAELSGKVTAFVSAGSVGKITSQTIARFTPIEEDAIAALMALGERRLDAENLLLRAKQIEPTPKSTDLFVREMLRLRGTR